MTMGEIGSEVSLSVPVLLPNGASIASTRSMASWRTLLGGRSDQTESGDPVTWAELMSESHHAFYGRPWFMGRIYFDKLVEFGLTPDSRVLDVGCGAGRLGSLLIPFLGVDAYAGFDNHLRSLVAFAAYEARLHALAPKRPKLLLTHDFDIDILGAGFDFAVDLSTMQHLPVELREEAYTRVTRAIVPGGRFVAWSKPPIGVSGMARLGFELERTSRDVHAFLTDPNPKKNSENWHVFRKS